MNYITSRKNRPLSNEAYELGYDDIEQMYYENIKNKKECENVTERFNKGESYYQDGRPGEGKDCFFALAKEILYRDVKTDGFRMEYPHGTILKQGERNSYYRGENKKTKRVSQHYIENWIDLKMRETKSYIG